MHSLWILVIIIIILVVLRWITFVYQIGSNYGSNVEGFNTPRDRAVLYDHPNQCPFDYLRFKESTPRNDSTAQYVVQSKIKGQPPELDMVYGSLDNYQRDWNQMKTLFPNIQQCGDPHQQYLRSLATQPSKIISNVTTNPIYPYQRGLGETTSPHGPSYGGRFQWKSKYPRRYQAGGAGVNGVNEVNEVNEVKEINLPSINTPSPIEVKELTRDEIKTSQLNPNAYLSTDTPQSRYNESIDTSVQPAQVKIPPTYTEEQIQQMKTELINDQFEKQREQQKIVLTLKTEIDRLEREYRALQEQLMYEKQHFTELNDNLGSKSQQIDHANQLNIDLQHKIAQLNQRNATLNEMYLQTEAQRNTYEVRLQTLRQSLEEERKTPGYTYLPPTNWTINQWRPPVCLSSQTNVVVPSEPGCGMGHNYMTVFDQTSLGTNVPYAYQTVSRYRPTDTQRKNESTLRDITNQQLLKDAKTDFLDPTQYPTNQKIQTNNLPYYPLQQRATLSYDTNGYKI